MDQPGTPKIEWVMQLEEESEEENLLNYCEYFGEEGTDGLNSVGSPSTT
ncbi:MAG: hypothetical protein AAF399_01740 [Bacteroidota bacterium]